MNCESRMKLAEKCKSIVEKAQGDLGGRSVLELVADNMEGIPLADIRDALFVAGLGPGVVR